MTAESSVLRHDAGFTLVEVLVAMFIFSLISVGTFYAMTSAVDSHDRVKAANQRLAGIETARTLIKSDLANVVLTPTRDPYGTQSLYVFSGGVDDLFNLTRTSRDNPGGLDRRGDLQRVVYRVEDAALIREVLAQTNPAPRTDTIRQTLLSGVERAVVEFFENDLSYNQLYIGNDPDATFSHNRVRLTLTFTDGDQLSQDFELAP
ncbi:MAG: type II secretion system minor pseudopilin GspJ [Hyphomonadaceae bacterium]|nr:type II secretion system minor pseudopilin GspJ [Hyphomonadaceae bacterium]MBC6412846.1 type II secretion system minor pseudopilin GspJ [Hyphomonadaceae bacterium]